MAGKLRQVHTALAGGSGLLVMGALNAWPSYTASVYMSNTTTPLLEPMTNAEESLLGSLPSLGAMLGTAVAGPVLNMMGRRNGGVLLSLPYVLSWAIIAIASSTNMVLAARFLSGIAGGGSQMLAPIFISEVSEVSIRGALASVPVFLYCLGIAFSYVIGWFLTYQTVIWVQITLSVCCTLIIMLTVESPVHLIRKKKDEAALLAIAKYRGVSVPSVIVAEEFSRLKQQIMPSIELVPITDSDTNDVDVEKEKLNSENVTPEPTQTMSPIKLLFLSTASRRGFVVVLTTVSLQVLMGIVPVQVHAKTIFKKTDPGHADMYTVIFALTQFCAGVVTMLVADRAGRRILLILSSVLVSVCMTALGFLISSQEAPAAVIVFLLLAYCFSFSLGAGPIPYVLLAEVFINEVLMGIVPVQVHAKTIFKKTDPGHADMYTVIFALTQFCAGVVTMLVADRAGRRILLILSSVLVSVCMTALGFLISSQEAPAAVIVFLLLAYCFSFSLGAGPIPYVLLAEVFINEVQSIALLILIEWVWFLNFFAIGVFPFLLRSIGIHGSFFVFASVGVTNAVIGYFIVPET